jgi:FeS assembly protein IscX
MAARVNAGFLKSNEGWLMGLKWVDSLDIAIELNDKYPDVDPVHVNFVDLRNWVLELDEFDDDPEHSGERILEAIQMAWLEEKD